MVPVLKEGNKNIYRINKKDNRRRVGGIIPLLLFLSLETKPSFNHIQRQAPTGITLNVF